MPVVDHFRRSWLSSDPSGKVTGRMAIVRDADMADLTSAMWSSADEPIDGAEQDRLSRRDFSRQLAKAIANWSGRQSLTVAVTGVWGSGKSSIKNMAVQALKELAPNVAVIEFNPWRWVSQDQLAEAFFREIGLAIGREADREKVRRAREKVA